MSACATTSSKQNCFEIRERWRVRESADVRWVVPVSPRALPHCRGSAARTAPVPAAAERTHSEANSIGQKTGVRCTHTHTNTHTHTHTHTQMYTHTHERTYTRTHTHKHMHSYTHTHTYNAHIYIHVCTHIHTCTLTTHTRTHSPTYPHVCVQSFQLCPSEEVRGVGGNQLEWKGRVTDIHKFAR